MGQFTPTKIILSDINSGEKYLDGDIVTADAINAPLEASAYAQSTAEEALVKADFALAQVNGAINPEYALSFNSVYPIGSVYITTKTFSPSSSFGGTWELIQDCFLYASGKLSAGDTGGSKDAVLVKHNHDEILQSSALGGNRVVGGGVSYGGGSSLPYVNDTPSSGTNSYAGGISTNEVGVDGTNKNMPPYLVVYMWKRVE